jgi:hypothetical protein
MQKLNEEEKRAIQAFISNYNDLFKKIITLEKKLEIISIQKEEVQKTMESINDEISIIRSKEKDYNDYLVNKYGPFKLNVETFEIESA